MKNKCKICFYLSLVQAAALAETKKKHAFYHARHKKLELEIGRTKDIARIKACSELHLEVAQEMRSNTRKDNKDLKERKTLLVILAAEKYINRQTKLRMLEREYGALYSYCATEQVKEAKKEKVELARLEEIQARKLLAQRLRRLRDLYAEKRLPENVLKMLKEKDIAHDTPLS